MALSFLKHFLRLCLSTGNRKMLMAWVMMASVPHVYRTVLSHRNFPMLVPHPLVGWEKYMWIKFFFSVKPPDSLGTLFKDHLISYVVESSSNCFFFHEGSENDISMWIRVFLKLSSFSAACSPLGHSYFLFLNYSISQSFTTRCHMYSHKCLEGVEISILLKYALVPQALRGGI